MATDGLAMWKMLGARLVSRGSNNYCNLFDVAIGCLSYVCGDSLSLVPLIAVAEDSVSSRGAEWPRPAPLPKTIIAVSFSGYGYNGWSDDTGVKSKVCKSKLYCS